VTKSERPRYCLDLMSERFFEPPRRKRVHRRVMVLSTVWWVSLLALLIVRWLFDFSSPPFNSVKLYFDTLVKVIGWAGALGMAAFVAWVLVEMRAELGRRRMLKEAAAEIEDTN